MNRICPDGFTQFIGKYIYLYSAVRIKTIDVSHLLAKGNSEHLSRRLVLLTKVECNIQDQVVATNEK